MRIISISSLDMQQTSMTINFPPRDPQTCLQINGIKIHSNEKTSRTLNKHREDAFMSESVFVNTDRIKFKGKFLPFEVQIDGCSSVLVYGGLKRKEGVEIKDECMWDMECREGDFGGNEFNGGFVDAYVAGRCLGKPLLLNEVVELKKWKDLDCFLEDDGTKSDTSKIYTVISRVATILQTRYTSPGFWLAGKGLFEEAERLATESSTKEHLRTCIKKAREHLNDVENQPEVAEPTVRNQRYLFEGHLTVDAEPPHPQWLVAQQFLFQMHAQQAASLPGQGENNGTREENNDTREENNGTTDADSEDNVTREGATQAMQELLNGMGMGQFDELAAAVEASLQVIGAGPSRPPPASKDVVNKLPIITVTKEILERLGSETECAVCREGLLVNDKMQELPCKHLFHPPCLKPWLDEHNSCPICRYELPTDDHAYESQKERDKEAEEERKGAANAVRGGEFMYV